LLSPEEINRRPYFQIGLNHPISTHPSPFNNVRS